jgi:hypothetical protein
MADGRRRGDIKAAAGWKSLYLPHPLPVTRRRYLRRLLERCYLERVNA